MPPGFDGHDAPRDGTATFDQYNIPSCPVSGDHFRLVRSGSPWRYLPKDFPPWETVYWWFRRFVRQLLVRTIHDLALMLDRERSGREASPRPASLTASR